MLTARFARGSLVFACLLFLMPSPAAASANLTGDAKVEVRTKAKRGKTRVAKRGRKRKKGKAIKARSGASKSRKARKGKRAARSRRGKKGEAAPAAEPVRATTPDDSSSAIVTTRRAPARVDFDDRLIQGQTNKSGAIYIFERKSSELHSMVRRRTSFRDEIMRTLE